MDVTNEYTKAKSKLVTSTTKASRHPLSAKPNTPNGVPLPTAEKDAEKMRDMLARLIDVTHNWPCKTANGRMPLPIVANGYLILAFPAGGHVIQNAVTSTDGQNFSVDGVLVIPVTSEAK